MAVYMHLSNKNREDRTEQDAIKTASAKHGITVTDIIDEYKSLKINWQDRQLGQLINGGKAQPGDTIVFYEACDMARSTSQALDILNNASGADIDVYFAKYDRFFYAGERNMLKDMLRLVKFIESDFISRRTSDALSRRRAAGLPLGRPKGRKNKSLKLDKYKDDIIKYIELGISKASIAKLVGCHPQTLYDWLDRNEVASKKRAAPGSKSNTSFIVEVEEADHLETV